ncbi:nucleotidyltransferase family protein [Aquincola sp. MAHUQ-54]|uniref:Nucleotidyltransferase family protein n=1 Tax=Aquincola agrisoli TaxID=3119538 RepID=A0AAW9QB63_9BURK
MWSQPTIIVLAAGRGSRFRGPSHKLAHPFDGAAPVLVATLRRAVASQLPVVVVTTAALESMARTVVASRDVVVLPTADSQPGLGMGSSIAAGVGARPHAPGWLVLPADMPLVRPSTLVAVAAALPQHPVAYAQHAGRRGHPVGFAAELFSDLVLLQGDEGARRLVARYPAQAVDVDDPGALIDLDTVEDLAAARPHSESVVR